MTTKFFKTALFLTVGFVLISSCVFAAGFQSFSSESSRATKALNCGAPKITPASYGLGALYGCIQGNAQTVKWFINEIPDTGRVGNIKFMWNDWFKDWGYGLHADKIEAQNALKVLIKLYAPKKGKEIEQMFWGNINGTIESDDFILKYTYSRGPSIDERMIVITPK